MRSRFCMISAAVFAVSAHAATDAATFNKDVLPILQKNCQVCHRPGEAAPFSLLTYESARPWAKAMKAAVVSRKMPPWFADPKVRPFSERSAALRGGCAHHRGLGGRGRSRRRREG